MTTPHAVHTGDPISGGDLSLDQLEIRVLCRSLTGRDSAAQIAAELGTPVEMVFALRDRHPGRQTHAGYRGPLVVTVPGSWSWDEADWTAECASQHLHRGWPLELVAHHHDHDVTALAGILRLAGVTLRERDTPISETGRPR